MFDWFSKLVGTTKQSAGGSLRKYESSEKKEGFCSAIEVAHLITSRLAMEHGIGINKINLSKIVFVAEAMHIVYGLGDLIFDVPVKTEFGARYNMLYNEAIVGTDNSYLVTNIPKKFIRNKMLTFGYLPENTQELLDIIIEEILIDVRKKRSKSLSEFLFLMNRGYDDEFIGNGELITRQEIIKCFSPKFLSNDNVVQFVPKNKQDNSKQED